ncbi:MAG: SRPBCC family protein [Thermoplasmata archaeon]|nr:SRPBCC family protein [Thermoplasmata archaeon]
MGEFKRTVAIKTTPDIVFNYVTDWRNLKSFMSNILDINPISFVQYGPGAAFDTVFKVSGAEIPTTLEVEEFVRDKRLILRSRQGFKIRCAWEFKPASDGTVVTITLQYDLPQGITRTESDRITAQQDLEQASFNSLQLLRWILESFTGQEKK